jgi:hypothetical protein
MSLACFPEELAIGCLEDLGLVELVAFFTKLSIKGELHSTYFKD